MNTSLKYKPVWFRLMVMGSLVLAAILVLQVLAALVVEKIAGMPLTAEALQSTTPGMITAQKVLLLLNGLILFALPVLMYSYIFERRPMHFLRLSIEPAQKYLLLAIIIMPIAIPSSSWIGQLNQHLDLSHTLPAVDKWIKAQETGTNKTLEAMVQNQSLRDLFINLFLMALVPAIGEELLFRGLLQKGIIRVTRNAWMGILLSAFIFSAAHFQFLTFLARFELGIILGALFWYSGSLWAPILAHFTFNGLQVLAAYKLQSTKVETPSSMVAATAAGISFLLVILLILIMKKASTVTMSEIYDDEDDDYDEDDIIIEPK